MRQKLDIPNAICEESAGYETRYIYKVLETLQVSVVPMFASKCHLYNLHLVGNYNILGKREDGCLNTLSHPKNDCDVTEHAKEYTLQNSFMRQSRRSFLNA